MDPDTATRAPRPVQTPDRAMVRTVAVGVLFGFGVCLMLSGLGGLNVASAFNDFAPGFESGRAFERMGTVFIGMGAFVLVAAILLRGMVHNWWVAALVAFLSPIVLLPETTHLMFELAPRLF